MFGFEYSLVILLRYTKHRVIRIHHVHELVLTSGSTKKRRSIEICALNTLLLSFPHALINIVTRPDVEKSFGMFLVKKKNK